MHKTVRQIFPLANSVNEAKPAAQLIDQLFHLLVFVNQTQHLLQDLSELILLHALLGIRQPGDEIWQRVVERILLLGQLSKELVGTHGDFVVVVDQTASHLAKGNEM